MTLEHVGIAVATPEQVALYERLLGAAPYKSERVEREGVETHFFGDGGQAGAAPKLELLEATADTSPVASFLARRGPGLHHLAFEVADLEREMARIRALGIRLLADTPKDGADGKRIVFLHPKDTAGVLVELVASVRPERRWVALEGGRQLAVSGPPAAPPLLVLHGALGSTALETDRLIRVWERAFQVHALDFRGHGRSDDLDVAIPRWQDYTSDAITAIEWIGRPALVFGFSLGGSIALTAALARPDAVAALAVHGANVQWDAAEVDAMTAPLDPGRLATDHPFWARRLAEVHGERWPRLVRQVAAFTQGLPDQRIPDDALAQIVCPTRISAGDRDRFFDIRHAVALYRALPDAELQILPGVDHPIQTVDAPPFAADVARFFEAALPRVA